MDTAFLLNGEAVRVTDGTPTRTLLEFLREEHALTGTKESCNEGDCGACTVMVTDEHGTHAMNACILFVPQLQGKAVRTIEGLSAPDGTLHPVQAAMVELNGTQCGFCTPGVVVSLAVAQANGAEDFNDRLAGNLCRCTGYAPIARAAEVARKAPSPGWIDDRAGLGALAATDGADDAIFRGRTSDELAAWYLAHPDARLVAGATDVGLWVTKQLRDLPQVAFVAQIDDLRGVRIDGERIVIGATTRLDELEVAIAPHYPDLAELLRRFGSAQVRAAATIGGNIGNGSPIGDSPPALIALDARLHLRKGAARREIALEDFFIAYGKQDRAPGEFIEAVSLPLPSAARPDRLRCYKLSKRFDEDISAVCGCLVVRVEGGRVREARLAYGGMAGTPKRATAAEAVLTGAEWTEDTVRRAMAAIDGDFTPMSDMRASAGYRATAARNMLWRYFCEDQGVASRVLEVLP